MSEQVEEEAGLRQAPHHSGRRDQEDPGFQGHRRERAGRRSVPRPPQAGGVKDQSQGGPGGRRPATPGAASTRVRPAGRKTPPRGSGRTPRTRVRGTPSRAEVVRRVKWGTASRRGSGWWASAGDGPSRRP